MVSNVQSCGEGVAYFIQNDDTVIIAGEGAIKDDSVVSWRIRDNIKTVIINEGVTGVGSKAFYEYANLESITVPDSVTSIGYQAFYGTAFANNDANREDGILYVNNILIDANDTIESVCTIKEGTKVISDNAFNGRAQLTSVIIPDSVTSIGQSAFEDCSNLTSITIPDSVTSIGQSAFDSCRKLTSVTIGSGVESIGAYAFEWCSGLTSITIPDSVTSIGNRAFYECNNLTSVTIGSGVKSIGFQVFYYCSGIESVYISDMAKWCEIEFSGDASNPMYYSTSAWFTSTACKLYLNNELVSELTIPDGVSKIGNYAFCGCGSLTSVTIPESVTSIGEEAFSYCKNLTSVIISGGVTSIGESAFKDCSGLTGVTIPDSVESIGSSAFSGCTSLTDVTIPDSVTSIGSDAFSGCKGLTSVTIPDSVTSIGESAFKGCSGLTGVTISDSVESIGNSAFSGCTSLTGVTIPDSVESIGTSAFAGCDSLTAFTVDENNANYSSEDGVLFNKNKTTLLIFPKSKAGDYIIPDSVTRIEDNAFYNCKSLTSIKIPDTIKEIGSDAFTYSSLDSPENVVDNVLYVDNCLIKTKSYRIGECSIKDGTRLIADNAFYDSNLKSVTIPDSVTSIGNGAFDRCYSLTNVTMGSGIERIGKTAFNYCRNLTSITIGSDVKRIGEDAFTNCNSLESVYITDLAAWCAIDFANESSNPLRYVNTPYLSGEMVTELVIPDGVTSIGKYAFRSCDGLTNVIIPDSVTSIGKNAFQYCSGLTSVTIGNGVTSIGESVFASCSGLTSVTIGSGIESIGEDAFYSCGNLTGVYISDIAKWCAIDFAKVDDDYDIDSNPLRYAKKLYLNNEPITDLVIPDSVTSIGKYAFCYCKDLTSVTLGSGVESIGEKAFYYCDNLESVYISDIAKWCAIDFANASSSQICYNRKLYLNGEIVTDIVIPDGVTSIAKYAFYNCRELTSVTIPVSVTSIGDYAFTNCNLDDVYYDGTETRWAKIDIGENNYNLNYASKHFSQNSDPEPDPMPTPLPEITAEITKTDSDKCTLHKTVMFYGGYSHFKRKQKTLLALVFTIYRNTTLF